MEASHNLIFLSTEIEFSLRITYPISSLNTNFGKINVRLENIDY